MDELGTWGRRDLVAFIVGTVAVVIVALGGLGTCAHVQDQNRDTGRRNREACFDHGGSWIEGNCIVPTGGR